MLFGDKHAFAIECHHDCSDNPNGYVFGRMCLWFGDVQLGDADEPVAILNTTEATFRRVLDRLDSQSDTAFNGLSPNKIFQVLEAALFGNAGRSLDDILRDSQRFARFDFLTTAGPSFDGTMSFVLPRGPVVQVLFRDYTDRFHAIDVPRTAFQNVIRAFLSWLSTESASAG